MTEMATVTHLRYVTFEVPPVRWVESDDFIWTIDPAPLPRRVKDEIEAVINAGPDGRNCAVCPHRAVGYVIAGDADERVEWRWATVIDDGPDGAAVWSVCEECAVALENPNQ